MADLLDRIRSELDNRIAVLRPSVQESARLQQAVDALDRSMAPAPPAVAAPPPRAPQGARAKPPGRRRAGPAGAARAAPGETQLRVIEQLRSGPGSTSTTVAKALGISANAAAATISRLVKQGRVQRLVTGGYAAADAAGDGSAAPHSIAPRPDSDT